MSVMPSFRVLLFISALAPSFAFQSTVSLPELARSVSPSVVAIATRDQNGNFLGQGTGFVVAPDGLIATNFHVVDGAYAASVILANGDIYDAVFVADADRRKDLVLIKIKALNLRPAKLGDSDAIQIGQHVVTVGNPSGLAGSVSDGIMSGVRQLVGMKILQITAPISPGSSGGPLLNDAGEVIGVTQATLAGQNLNFAVPVNYLKPLINFLNQSQLTTLAAFNAGALKSAAAKPAKPKADQSASNTTLDGAWSATISDAKGSASWQFNLVQDSAGDVIGTYTTSLGGAGQIKGALKDSELVFELTQSTRGCAGVFRGTAKVEVDRAVGTYTGTDCQGDHGKGTLTMTRAGSSPQPPPRPPNVQVVDGRADEMRGVRYVFVSAEKNLPARNEIVHLLTEGGLRTVSDYHQADLLLYFQIVKPTNQYSQQGELIVADIVGQAFRPNPPSGWHRVWTYGERVVKPSVTEQDIAKTFTKAFLNVFRHVNR
ncbi:MAG: trypsin-like peptidase domain-containing protein [Bryobacteraceae bacterium]|jgi:S1-C subfamily serine protease